MEVDYTNEFQEKELKMYRSFMNTKIDIFQDSESFVFRTKSVKQPFFKSYEHELIQNEASGILSNSSDLLVFSLGKELDNLTLAKHQLKKSISMSKTHETDIQMNTENEYKNFKKKIMMKKLANDSEYKQLSDFISSPQFESLMKTNINFARFILKHKYLCYHPKYEEIKTKYKKLLCPAYASASSNTSNNSEEEN